MRQSIDLQIEKANGWVARWVDTADALWSEWIGMPTVCRFHGLLSAAPTHPHCMPCCPFAMQSASGGDIRLILGQLQMIRLRAKSLTYDQAKGEGRVL